MAAPFSLSDPIYARFLFKKFPSWRVLSALVKFSSQVDTAQSYTQSYVSCTEWFGYTILFLVCVGAF